MIRSILCSVGLTSCIAVADVFEVPGDFATITQAMNAAEATTGSPHTILVGPGTYNESIIFKNNNITVESVSGPEETIIDAADIYYRCVDVKQTAFNCKLNGFTLQNGYTINDGGGVRIVASLFTIENCVIQSCRAEELGGAVYASERIVLSDSIIQDNSAGGYGGGLYLDENSSQNEISGSQFINNTVDSLSADRGHDVHSDRSRFAFQNTIFTNQFAVNSFAIFSGSPGTMIKSIDGCTFVGPGQGRAIYQYGICCTDTGLINIDNCTIESWETGILIAYSLYEDIKVSNTSISTCDTALNVTLGSAGSVEIDGCYFSRNTGSNGSALDINDSDAVNLYDSTFCENTVPAILGNYESLGGNVFLPSCDTLTGVCCIAGACTDLTEQQCFFAGGQFSGYNKSCQEFVCTVPVIVGACCVNGNAITLEESDCSLVSGQFFGEGSNPDDVSCESDSSCPEDLDGNGEVGFPDLLEIISAWGPCSG